MWLFGLSSCDVPNLCPWGVGDGWRVCAFHWGPSWYWCSSRPWCASEGLAVMPFGEVMGEFGRQVIPSGFKSSRAHHDKPVSLWLYELVSCILLDFRKGSSADDRILLEINNLTMEVESEWGVSWSAAAWSSYMIFRLHARHGSDDSDMYDLYLYIIVFVICVCVCICMYVCMSVSLSVCLSVCMYVFVCVWF